MKKCESCKGTGVWKVTSVINEPCPDCMGSGFDIPDKSIDLDLMEQEEEFEAWEREMYG